MEAFLHHGGPFSCSQGLHDPAESPAPLHDGPYGGGASSPGLRGGLQCPPPALQGSLGSHDSPQMQLASPQGLMHEDPRGPAKPLEAQSLGLHDSAASLLDLGELDKSMGHMQALIIREVVKDIEVACSLLHVPADPESWSCRHVDKWLAWSVHQYGLGPLCLDFLRMDGASLCRLSEEDFRLRASRAGELLHAHLDVWRSAARFNSSPGQMYLSTGAPGAFDYLAEELGPSDADLGLQGLADLPGGESPQSLGGGGAGNPLSAGGTWDPDAQPHGEEGGFPGGPGMGPPLDLGRALPSPAMITPNHTASIHLWQFLKELLLQPEAYSHCIRWIDREKAIFKIEDSVEVARLWGIRKNRPAMNYDKLSRSIRQYYKKGIIRKTEISQRLVYQFVKPV
ncbi:SAM pointed domain-containing Ets transcription factor-like isoform X2 [Lethenteron reissneri]|nr:SAM pointed domain-containing Ets transcription factor-like isoform X2 [Lethenteron reissneri]